MRGSKIPVQELWLKMGGGRNSGILRYYSCLLVHLLQKISGNDLTAGHNGP